MYFYNATQSFYFDVEYEMFIFQICFPLNDGKGKTYFSINRLVTSTLY